MENNQVWLSFDLGEQIKIALIIDVNEHTTNDDIEKEAEKILIDKFGSNLLDQVDAYFLHPYES
jgi:hypothetical protein